MIRVRCTESRHRPTRRTEAVAGLAVGRPLQRREDLGLLFLDVVLDRRDELVQGLLEVR
jgi:hypothetical protein